MAEERAIALDKLARALDKLKATGLPLNDWQANKKYKVNYPVLHENKLYRCIEEHTASSTFDETKWEVVSKSENGISLWQVSTEYGVGDILIYNDCIYKCDTAHTSTSTFDATKFTQLTYEQEVDVDLIGDIFGGAGV